jgi:hypothetical protein
VAALQSKLFRSDPRFDDCLQRDSAHILTGARGYHVACIQFALVMLNGNKIDQKELNGALYGPSTAAAVLDFKRRRNIINPAYQTQADNIVGKMTIAQLDREMRLREAIASAVGQEIEFQG